MMLLEPLLFVPCSHTLPCKTWIICKHKSLQAKEIWVTKGKPKLKLLVLIRGHFALFCLFYGRDIPKPPTRWVNKQYCSWTVPYMVNLQLTDPKTTPDLMHGEIFNAGFGKSKRNGYLLHPRNKWSALHRMPALGMETLWFYTSKSRRNLALYSASPAHLSWPHQ